MSTLFSPGCALMVYKPELAKKMEEFLLAHNLIEGLHLACCHHEPEQQEGTLIINTCAGCDRRFRELYDTVDTISLWEVLADNADFPFPDYGGAKMSVHDACPTRNQPRVHIAVRKCLERMNIVVVEHDNNRENSTCCGASYKADSYEKAAEYAHLRAAGFPCEDVVTYCADCPQYIAIGGKKPRYLVDLLFGEETQAVAFANLMQWDNSVGEFIETH